MKIDDTVYIKSYRDKRKITPYKIVYLNDTHAIISTLNNKLHKKVSLDLFPRSSKLMVVMKFSTPNIMTNSLKLQLLAHLVR